jgi:hypothetical protein
MADNCLELNFKRLPQAWINIIVDAYERAPERSAWADFNCAYFGYRRMDKKATRPLGRAIFCPEDVPDAPDPDDYPDVDLERDCIRD